MRTRQEKILEIIAVIKGRVKKNVIFREAPVSELKVLINKNYLPNEHRKRKYSITTTIKDSGEIVVTITKGKYFEVIITPATRHKNWIIEKVQELIKKVETKGEWIRYSNSIVALK